MSASPTRSGILFKHAMPRSRKKRAHRSFAVEALETRALLSYTFVYTNPNSVTVNENGGSDSFNVIQSGGQLEYSINGGAFSANWGGAGNNVNASNLTTVTINLAADNSAIILGSPASAASDNFATFSVAAAAGNTSDSLTINDGARTLSGGSYSVDTLARTINGPASGVDVVESATVFGGGTTIEGNGASNTLDYNAAGSLPAVSNITGGVQISLATFGALDAINYSQINIANVPTSTPISPGPARTINSIEGFNLSNVIVGTFSLAIPPIITPPAGLPASDFTATINWGDGTATSAATIVQDASDPSVYDVVGSHEFAAPSPAGGFTITPTILFAGGMISGTVNGSNVVVSFAPLGPTAGNAATANVNDGTLAVSAYPIVGTEGKAIPAGPIATFIDAGGADAIGDYSASISVVNADGATVVGPIVGTITQNGTAAQFTVSAPSFTLAEEGTYQVVVAVTDSGPPTPITVTGAASAVIADAPLAAGSAAPLTVSTGTALPLSTVVGTFTDANPTAPISDFTATIDWGDGSPASAGSITQPGGVGTPFDVLGGHTYTQQGTYNPVVVVTDVGGSRVTLNSTSGPAAVVTVSDGAPTGVPTTFTAVEGQNTGPIVLATVTDPNPLATISDLAAFIDNWGDATPATPQPLSVVLIGGTATSTTFQIIGSHTYAEEGLGLPVTLTVTTAGGAPTTFTPATGTANVHDALLTSSNGTSITGTEGIATPATTLIGTFQDANQGATSTDFTAGGGSVVVNWGDGSPLQTLASANLSPTPPTTEGTGVFSITAAHTYAEEGQYAITIIVTDAGGASTTISSTALISDAPLTAPAQTAVHTTEAGVFPVPEFGPPAFTGQVATFTDANPGAPVSDFTATIDWGDGTAPTAGTIAQPGGVGTALDVTGSHTYADAGTGSYPIQVFVVDVGGSKLTVDNTADVADRPIVLTGQLNPTSDSGVSNTDDITNVTQPDFFGTSEAFSHVTLFETPLAGGVSVLIGQIEAGSDGSWNIVSSIPLADGSYRITANAVDQFGDTTVTNQTITSDLVIDTVAPVVTSAFFNRLNGQVDYVIQDPSPASGVNVASLLDSSNYLLTKVHANKAYPGKWIVTNITETADPTLANAYDVAVTFNSGRVIRGGFYLFTIRDSSNGSSSVRDIAGNHLDGVFYGNFPSGNGIPGSDFVAMLSGYHDKIFSPQTIKGTASAGNGGIGGTPVGAVHSGVFSPIVPRGGSPVFGTIPATARVLTPAVKVRAATRARIDANEVKSHASSHPHGPFHITIKQSSPRR